MRFLFILAFSLFSFPGFSTPVTPETSARLNAALTDLHRVIAIASDDTPAVLDPAPLALSVDDPSSSLPEAPEATSFVLADFYVFIPSIILLALLMLAVWVYWRQRRQSTHHRHLIHQHQEYQRMLHRKHALLSAIPQAQHDALFVLNRDGRYVYLNRSALAHAKLSSSDDALGKTMAHVLGPSTAHSLEPLNAQAHQQNQPVSHTHHFDDGGVKRILRSTHIPLQQNHLLVVLHDLTDVVTSHSKQHHTLHEIMQTLVSLLACRDPYAARHAQFTAQVATALADEMGVSAADKQTTLFAADLITLHKLLVPQALIDKKGELTPEEKRFIHKTILQSTDILAHIDFGLPVVATLQQRLEHWDGSGQPKKLKGRQILVSARILAVANAFVAMVSPRAYRKPLSFTEALHTLLMASEKLYDPRVVAALMHYVNNKYGMQKWQHFQTLDLSLHPEPHKTPQKSSMVVEPLKRPAALLKRKHRLHFPPQSHA